MTGHSISSWNQTDILYQKGFLCWWQQFHWFQSITDILVWCCFPV